MTAARVPLSACVIAMNEADRISRCLESLSFCDEIVVLDSGSTDGTQDLCRGAGARVIETDWPGWVAQKNRAVEAAQHDWILSLDADECVDAELRSAIETLRDEALALDDAPCVYSVCRKVYFFGRWIRHGGWYPEWRARLFDRRHARWGGKDPHDRIEHEGRAQRIEAGHLEHYTYRSFNDYLERMVRYSGVGAAELHARGRRGSLWSVISHAPFRFVRMYVFRRGFLDGQAGFVLAMLASIGVFFKYARLWEMGRRGPGDAP